MEFLLDNILTLTVFSPLAAALIIFLLPDDEKVLIRRLSFVLSLIPLALTLVMWLEYNANYRLEGMQFQVMAEWFPAIGSSFHMGVDGISLPLILLTVILTPLAILASFNIEDKVKMYMSLFLALETGMLGLFASSGPDYLLHFLGSWPGADVFPHPAVGRQRSRLRLLQILHLHHGRQPGAAPLHSGDGHCYGYIQHH
jgi:NADH-quinone oxidoreductase subunit M